MPKALANRLLHIEVSGSFESWKKWAIGAGVNRKVLGYLSFRRDRLFGFNATNDELAFPTPRSWEMVSNILNTVSENVEKIYPLICGLIGVGQALEFKVWCSVFSELPDVEKIFAGRETLIPKKADVMYALVSSMTSFAAEHKYDAIQIGNSLTYARNLPADFGELLIQNYLDIEKNYEKFLMTVPEYYEYSLRNAIKRNGNVE